MRQGLEAAEQGLFAVAAGLGLIFPPIRSRNGAILFGIGLFAIGFSLLIFGGILGAMGGLLSAGGGLIRTFDAPD